MRERALSIGLQAFSGGSPVVQILPVVQLWCQLPKVVDKVGEWALGREASAADTHRFKDTCDTHTEMTSCRYMQEMGRKLCCAAQTKPDIHLCACLYHSAHTSVRTATAKLMQSIAVLKQTRRVGAVGLHTADIMRLHGVQLRHELAQLPFELTAN